MEITLHILDDVEIFRKEEHRAEISNVCGLLSLFGEILVALIWVGVGQL